MGRIAFNQIPVTWRVPGVNVEFDWSAGNQGLVRSLQRLLIVAYHPGNGFPVAADTAFLVESYDHAVQVAGRGSLFAQMVKTAKKANRVNELWAILVDEPNAGVKAAGAITLTGPASAAGTIPLMVDGQLVQVGVAASDTAATIATAAIAAINANTDLSVTAAIDGVNTAKVNITCRWKGAVGNGVDLRVGYWRGLAAPAGAGIAVTAFAGGAGVPDLTAAIDALAPKQYHHVITPFADSVTLHTLAEEMERRWDAMVQKEGQVWSAAPGSLGTLTTLGSGLNSDALSVMGIGKSPTSPWIAASAYGAAAAKA
ncbi:MAG: phage tail protein, partial [Magnetospirillum sp.]